MSALCTSEATPGDVKEVKRVAQHERRKRFDMATATANLKLKKKTPTGIDAVVDGVFDHIPVRFPVAE